MGSKTFLGAFPASTMGSVVVKDLYYRLSLVLYWKIPYKSIFEKSVVWFIRSLLSVSTSRIRDILRRIWIWIL
jgi:hypothetical protein